MEFQKWDVHPSTTRLGCLSWRSQPNSVIGASTLPPTLVGRNSFASPWCCCYPQSSTFQVHIQDSDRMGDSQIVVYPPGFDTNLGMFEITLTWLDHR